MSAIRFPRIGAITKCPDGAYSVGPLPGIGGPFDSAAQFFDALARKIKFPLREESIRERTPPDLVDEVLRSITALPARLRELAQKYHFLEGPFPLFHTDLYTSNMIIDEQYNLLAVIDWEDALVVPWEMVEFAKELSIVPPVMDGSLYRETEAKRQQRAERKEYVELARQAETTRGLDDRLSAILADSDVQNFAHAVWLFQDGRIGLYDRVLEEMMKSLSP